MGATDLLVLAVLVAAWALVSRPLSARGVSGPMVFLFAGVVLSQLGIVDVTVNSSSMQRVVELALVLSLFVDASGANLRELGRHGGWAGRMLLIGLPLTILLGTGTAMVVLPVLTWSTALLLSASLAATDASLSAGVLADVRVPSRVRLALNMESGLNDGLATPVVLAAVVAAATAMGLDHSSDPSWAFVVDLVGGTLLGAAAGAAGSWMINEADKRNWVEPGGRRLAVLALPVGVFAAADVLGVSVFIAAFVAGLAFGAHRRLASAELTELPEFASETLAWVTWFLFGAGLLVHALQQLDARMVVYALLALTVLRMGPVALSLLRSGADRPTIAFLGWFGPRGLATTVFGLIILDELGRGSPAIDTVLGTMSLTIVLSVVAHAFSASPMAVWLQRSSPSEPETAPAAPGQSPG